MLLIIKYIIGSLSAITRLCSHKTLVEHSIQNFMVKGWNPDTGTRRKKKARKSVIYMMKVDIKQNDTQHRGII